MNERILKIAQQTDIWCDQNYSGDDHYDQRWELQFAELIVRECANIANHAEPYRASDLILKHFGIIQPKSLLCPKCGIDRTKYACPRGYGAAVDSSCPMVFKAQ